MDIMTNPGFAKLYKQAFPELGESISETLPAVSKSVGKSNFSKAVKIGVTLTIVGLGFYFWNKSVKNKKNLKK